MARYSITVPAEKAELLDEAIFDVYANDAVRHLGPSPEATLEVIRQQLGWYLQKYHREEFGEAATPLDLAAFGDLEPSTQLLAPKDQSNILYAIRVPDDKAGFVEKAVHATVGQPVLPFLIEWLRNTVTGRHLKSYGRAAPQLDFSNWGDLSDIAPTAAILPPMRSAASEAVARTTTPAIQLEGIRYVRSIAEQLREDAANPWEARIADAVMIDMDLLRECIEGGPPEGLDHVLWQRALRLGQFIIANVSVGTLRKLGGVLVEQALKYVGESS